MTDKPPSTSAAPPMPEFPRGRVIREGGPPAAKPTDFVLAALIGAALAMSVSSILGIALAERIKGIEHNVKQLHAEHDEAPPVCAPVIFTEPMRVEMR